MSIFYAPEILSHPVLPEEESAHAVKVLRLKEGDEIFIVNGVGGYFKAIITYPHPKHCGIEILEQLSEPARRDYKLHIAIAPTKNIDRLEWFIEKATEIGVDQITPLITRYSERKVIKPERLQKVIVSASKQSQKATFPALNPLVSFQDFIKTAGSSLQFIAHCYPGDKKLLQQLVQSGKDILVMIGPEGDFSEEEVQSALNAGFIPISLGDSRLRTETAGLLAVATVQIMNQF